MGKITTAIKNAVTRPKVEIQVKKASVASVCSNCNDSGMTCSVCHVGKVQD